MIKKLCLLIVSVLLVVAIVNVHRSGLEIRSFKVPSYNVITQKNETLNSDIKRLNDINTIDYNAATQLLAASQKNFKTRKSEYEDMASGASAADIAEANKEENYLLDYLWIKIGNYAEANDIKVLIDPAPSTHTIKFDVSGQYISLINFIYDLENDKELAFNVDNIIMEGASNATSAKATFTVGGIDVITAIES